MSFPSIPAGMGWPFVDATTGEFQSSAVKSWLRSQFIGAFMPEAFGPIGTGDDTYAVQAAINAATSAGGVALLPEGHDYIVTRLDIPEGSALRVDGRLILKAGTAGAMIHGFENRVHLIINGVVDGNRANQTTYVDEEGLIHFEGVDGLLIEGAGVVTRNYFPNAAPAGDVSAAILVRDSNNVHVRDVTVDDYAREGVWFRDCTNSTQENITARGGTDSWSGAQASGDNIIQTRIRSFNAGASGIGLDATKSVQSFCYVEDNRFFHGYNYGHDGYLAQGVTVIGCEYVLTDPGVNLSATSNGFQVGADSVDVHFIGASSRGAKTNGFQVSDGASRVTLTGCSANGSGSYGLNVFGAVVTGSDNDLADNTSGPVTTGGTGPVYRLLNTRTAASTWVHTMTNATNEHIGNSTFRNDVLVSPANGSDYRELAVQRVASGNTFKALIGIAGGAIFQGTKNGSTMGHVLISDARGAFVSSIPVGLPTYTTAGRPSAATAGAGAVIYDTTLGYPVYSNGTNWRKFSDNTNA